MIYSPFVDSIITDSIGAVSTGVNYNQVVYVLPTAAYIYAEDIGSSGQFTAGAVTAEPPVGYGVVDNKLWDYTGVTRTTILDGRRLYPAGTNIRVNVTGNTNANYRIRIHALLVE